MMQWNTLLKSLGFTDSEAKIYLLSLELGPSSVQDIAKKAKVSRVTTYAVIESLAKHGLMSSVEKGKKTLYAAESPDRLVSFMHTKMKEMENTLREVQSAINELKLVQRGDRPVVRLFEGKEGLKAIHDDILKADPDIIYELNNEDAMFSTFARDELMSYATQLDKQKTVHEALVLSSKHLKSREHAKLIQLPMAEFAFFGNVTVYANRVALTTFQGKNISVLIESEILAQSMKELFKLAYQGAEKYRKA